MDFLFALLMVFDVVLFIALVLLLTVRDDESADDYHY